MSDVMMKHLRWRFWYATPAVFLKPGLYYCHKANTRIFPLPPSPAPMALVEFKEQTVVYAKDQPQYRPLPAYRYPSDSAGRIVCCWQPRWIERILIACGRPIWHSISTFGEPLQPQLLSIAKPHMPKVQADV